MRRVHNRTNVRRGLSGRIRHAFNRFAATLYGVSALSGGSHTHTLLLASFFGNHNHTRADVVYDVAHDASQKVCRV